MAEEQAIIPYDDPQRPQKIAGGLLQCAADAKPFQASSFDPSTPEGGIMLVKATLMPCIPLKEMIGKHIDVAHFYAHVAGTVDSDGEFDEFTRIVLFDGSGQAYQCAARGVAKSLAVLAYARGSLHFNPPIKCEVKLLQLKGTKQWLTLIPDLDSLGAKARKR